MAEITYSEALAQGLQGKVIVVTGGAQGIGAATVTELHTLGAHVYFGDWDEVRGIETQEALQASPSAKGGSAHFRLVDVRDYSHQLALFDAAYRQQGRVDAAISCAAVKEPSGWFEPGDLNLDTVRKEPTPINDAITINLTSVIHFSRLALAYIQASPREDGAGSSSPSITLVSSIAGITEAPGLFSYASAKHGIIGLMRALRPWSPTRYHARVNALCPWATDTQLLAGVRERWVAASMPLNTPVEVARLIVQCAADPELNGRAVFVSGGRGFDTEAGIDAGRPEWMGAANAAEFEKGQEILGLGGEWTSRDK